MTKWLFAKVSIRNQFGGTGVSPVQAQAEACGYKKWPFDRNSVSEDKITVFSKRPGVGAG
jgi:hypothetical protein